MDDLRIVDAHHHLWDLEGPIRYPWLANSEHAGFLGDYSRIRRSYLPPEFRRDSRLHHVVGTVHVEAECDRSQQLAETEWLTQVKARYGMPSAIVAHAWVDTPNAEEILAKQAANPLVVGIRTKPVVAASPRESVKGQPRSIQDPAWRRGIGLLVKYKLSWDLRVPWWHLEEAAEVVREHPGLAVVLNHTGFPWDRSAEGLAGWRQGMRALAACPNVHCKISALSLKDQAWTLAANQPIIRETIDIFGAGRCMFASNHPVDGVKASWDWIYRCFKQAVAHLPLSDQEGLFADNAIRFYRIRL